MTSLVFTVPGRPMSWQRAAVGAAGKITSYARGKKSKRSGEKIAAFKKTVWLAARQALGRAAWEKDRGFEVTIRAYYPDSRFGDIDRIPGLVLDALQGLAYVTDRQVYRLTVDRYVDKENPRIDVVVRPEAIGAELSDDPALETAAIIDCEVRR